MAFPFGTPEWAAALQDEINSSSEYRNAAAQWGLGFNGNVLLCFEADEQLERPIGLLVRLAGGTCEGADFIDADSHPDAGFVLRGPTQLWREIRYDQAQTWLPQESGAHAMPGQSRATVRGSVAGDQDRAGGIADGDFGDAAE